MEEDFIVKLKKVLKLLHEDGAIDCNQYQGEDFDNLLKRLEKEN